MNCELPAKLAAASRKEVAMARLHRLSFIGFHEQYAVDFGKIVRKLRLPAARAVLHANATIRPRALEGVSRLEETLNVVVAPLVRWDDELYRYARSLR